MIALPLRLLFALSALVLFVGCDLYGDYALRVEEAATKAPPASAAGGGDVSLLHADATPIKGTDGQLLVTMKLPTFFAPAESAWLVTGGKDKNGKDITADRANPPGTPIPGWAATYEVYVDDGAGKKLPVYVYFGGVPYQGDLTKAEGDLHRQMAVGLKKLSPAWADSWKGEAQGDQPLWTGTTLTADMPFDGTQAGGGDVTVPGRLDMFTGATATHVVIVGWRCPAACVPRINFEAALNAALKNATMASQRPGGAPPGVPGVVPPPGA